MRQPSRWKRKALLLVVMALAATLAFSWSALRTRALAATAFAAQTGCACHEVSGLGLSACRSDIAAAGMGRVASLVMLSADDQTHEVTASVPFVARQHARFDPAGGCQLESWPD